MIAEIYAAVQPSYAFLHILLLASQVHQLQNKAYQLLAEMAPKSYHTTSSDWAKMGYFLQIHVKSNFYKQEYAFEWVHCVL